MERAIVLAQKAVTMDDSSGLLHSRLGYLYSLNKEFDKANCRGGTGGCP